MEASKILKVHRRTLYNWEKKGIIDVIRTASNYRMYNVNKYLHENMNIKKEFINAKLNICYARVSSNKQKDDLIRQKEMLINLYPDHMLIEDIGSGINLNRRGLRKIIRLAIDGKINELVVVYKDRLTRYGYDLIEDLIKEYSNGRIKILINKSTGNIELELSNDVLELMNVYVAKRNGLRKYKN